MENVSIKDALALCGIIHNALNEEIAKNGYISKYSQIGKRIKVRDNSYNHCIQTNHWSNLIGDELIIISEPYEKQVHEGVDFRIHGEYWCTMVKAYNPRNGMTYEIMFHEGWLVD